MQISASDLFIFKKMQISFLDYSIETMDVAGTEVRKLVQKAYSRAKTIITTHIDIHINYPNFSLKRRPSMGEEFMSLFIDGKA